jgi:putative ABC transport system permease protein
MGISLRNIVYALRQFRRSPGFAATVIVTLALGIGATAAIFTLFDQVLLRMLPVEKPQELVQFHWKGSFSGSMSAFGGDTGNYFSYPMYKDLRDQNRVFSGMLAVMRAGAGVSWHGQADSEDVEIVSGNAFDVLGLKPSLGRLLHQTDDTQKNANPVLVLSYEYWKTRFAADPSIAGQTVLINGHPFTVLGVAPKSFTSAIGGYRPGVFIPISMSEVVMPWMATRDNFTNRRSLWLTLIARLKPGVSIAQAEAGMTPLWKNLRRQELPLFTSRTPQFTDRYINKAEFKVLDDSRGFSPGRMELKTPLVILISMAGLLTLMCAINVATLLLLRASKRTQEMAMRYALGAKRSRIVSQLTLEGGLLGLAGAAGGLLIAPTVAHTLVRILTSSDPGNEPYSAAIDMRVLLFTLGLSVLVSLLFSIAPAVHFIRPNLMESLRQNVGTASKGSQRFRKFAVGLQIALSVMLLGGAGLFVRTLQNLRHQQIGFQTSNLDTFGVDPTESGYSGDRVFQTEDNVIEAVRRVPGVIGIAGTSDPELSGDSSFSHYEIQGYKFSEDEKSSFENEQITPGYFGVLRQPVLAGREFTAADAKNAPKVAIVNLEFAKKFFGSPQNALGRLIGEDKPDATIVGVVGNIKHQNLHDDIGPAVYTPYAQAGQYYGLQFYVHTAQPPETLQQPIREAVHQLDPILVVDGLRTMEAQVDDSASDQRALAVLAIAFSVLAMVLAAVGLYGVLAYSTEQRTREIGVRLALGAQRSSVVALVLREMLLIAFLGVVVAIPSVIGLARLFRNQLYGVGTADPLALIVAVGLTSVMVAAAAALPARRAVSIQPMQALRLE